MAMRNCASCQKPLSAYNNSARCRACQVTVSHKAPTWALDSSEFRTAMAACEPGAALAAIRKAAQLSQAEFAAVLGWETATYVRAERGRTQTLYDIRELHRVADTLGIPRQALTPLLLSSPSAANQPTGDGEHDMNRRSLGKAGFAAAAGWAAFPGLADASTVRKSAKVSLTQVTFLRSAVERFNAANQQFGAAAVVKPAFDAYQHARSLLDSGDYPEAVGIALAAAVADLAGCAGWQAYDCDMQQLARRCYNDALVLAEQSDDTGLAIRLLGNMTRQACHLAPSNPGLAREATRLSARAIHLASRSRPMSSSMHAHVATLDAIAQAAVGDASGFERAIGYAWREVDRGLECGEDDPVWFGQYLTVSEIRANEAKGWRLLSQHQRADQVLRAIVPEDSSAPLYGLLYRINLAANSAAQADTTDAVAQGLGALSGLEAAVKSTRLIGELKPVRTAAAISKADAAGEFIQRYDALRAA